MVMAEVPSAMVGEQEAPAEPVERVARAADCYPTVGP